MKKSSLSSPWKIVHNINWKYLVFWCLVFFHGAVVSWHIFNSPREAIESISFGVLLQFGTAYICLRVIVPKTLNQGRRWLFWVLLLLLLFLMSGLYMASSYFYFERAYPETYKYFLKIYGHLNFWQRMMDIRVVVFGKFLILLFPTFMLAAYEFYQEQKKLLVLKEQKKTAELLALKRQLNPHFLFNTLNNLYALTLKKSDLAPVVIEKISAILDYMLYRCEEKFVSLRKEIDIMEDYIHIEKIRYGKRLCTTMTYELEEDVQIAPLLLLNLVENACKHSTKHELDQAKLDISIQLKEGDILIDVGNTIPPFQPDEDKDHDTQIGLKNLKNQLALIYPESHQFQILETDAYFEVKLRVSAK